MRVTIFVEKSDGAAIRLDFLDKETLFNATMVNLQHLADVIEGIEYILGGAI